MDELQDKNIKCGFIGCELEFVHSIKDQEFYLEKKYVDPKYCKFHREQRKAEKARKEQEIKGKVPLDSYNFDKN